MTGAETEGYCFGCHMAVVRCRCEPGNDNPNPIPPEYRGTGSTDLATALAVPEVRALTVGEAALEHMLDRRGIRGVLEQIRDEDPEIWKEICEETGRAALAALRGEGRE